MYFKDYNALKSLIVHMKKSASLLIVIPIASTHIFAQLQLSEIKMLTQNEQRRADNKIRQLDSPKQTLIFGT